MAEYSVHCPRCDRVYRRSTVKDAWTAAKKHVAFQHPDHNPEWADKD